MDATEVYHCNKRLAELVKPKGWTATKFIRCVYMAKVLMVFHESMMIEADSLPEDYDKDEHFYAKDIEEQEFMLMVAESVFLGLYLIDGDLDDAKQKGLI